MYIDTDTLLVTVYTLVDDVYRAEFDTLRSGVRGPKPAMSDSEVLTIALMAQWQRSRSEREFLRYVDQHWRSYFPRLLSQSEFSRRTRDLVAVLCQIGPLVVRLFCSRFGVSPTHNIIDGVPVRLMRLCRGHKTRVFGNEASVGRGGSDRDWYYGVQLLVSADSEGFIDGFVLGPASTEERWLAEALFRWRFDPSLESPSLKEMQPLLGPSHQKGGGRIGPTGPISCRFGVGLKRCQDVVADKGFVGQKWLDHWQEDYGVNVIVQTEHDCLPPIDRHRANRWLHSLRQDIETINNTLVDTFGLEFPRARSFWGLLTRIAAKVAAYDIAVYINKALQLPTFSMPNPLA